MRKLLSALLITCLLPLAAIAQTSSEAPLNKLEENNSKPSEKGVEPGSESKGQEQGAAIDSAPQPMTSARLAEIILALDKNASVSPRRMQLVIADVPITVVLDPVANRMRAFSPFKTLDGVDGQALYRMMQANFDSALDARYAIARGYLISVFIHPLAELQKDQFIESIGQVVNLVKTFGSAYTSGAMTFGGGDSNKLHRQLIDELLKKGEEI